MRTRIIDELYKGAVDVITGGLKYYNIHEQMSQLGASDGHAHQRSRQGEIRPVRASRLQSAALALRPSADDDLLRYHPQTFVAHNKKTNSPHRPLRHHLPNCGASGTRTGGPRCPARTSTLQQPGEVLVHDKRDARAGEHPDEVRAQAAVEPRRALVLPGVCDRGRDGAVVRAREHRVALWWWRFLVS
jgi:hypothetical protein